MVHRIEETVARDICSGCGACAVITGGAVAVRLGIDGLYRADLSAAAADEVRLASSVCPFSDEAATEDQLGAPHGTSAMADDPVLGAYSRTWAGRHTDDDFLVGSSSGGLTTWLLQELLEQGLVDAVIHVGSTEDSGAGLFHYTTSTSVAQLRSRRKSQYHAVTMAEVLAHARDSDQSFALVGVPCFIRAARLLARKDPEIARRIRFYVGLVCGHLKSQTFARSLAWQVGVPPDEVAAVDFRIKVPGSTASQYEFGAWREGSPAPSTQRSSTLVGGNWGHGAMQPEACNFCEDIFAETADVCFGDAWLPEYVDDWRGTNVVVCRNDELGSLFEAGARRGLIELEEISAERTVQSQAGNVRHRRIGLAVRLADDMDSGASVPTRRVLPSRKGVSRRRVRLIRQRRRMSAVSLDAFVEAQEAGSLGGYITAMEHEVKRYRAIDASLPRRFARIARSRAQKILNWRTT